MIFKDLIQIRIDKLWMIKLPDDILTHIILFLDIKSMCNFGLISRRIYVSQQKSWWHKLIKDYKILPYFELEIDARESYKLCFKVVHIVTDIMALYEKLVPVTDDRFNYPFGIYIIFLLRHCGQI